MILKVFLIFSFILANSLVTNIKEVSGWKIKMKKINKASVELKEKIHKYTKAIGILRSNSGRVIAGVDHMISALLLSLNKRLAFLNGINNGVTVLNKNLRQFLKKHPGTFNNEFVVNYLVSHYFKVAINYKILMR